MEINIFFDEASIINFRVFLCVYIIWMHACIMQVRGKYRACFVLNLNFTLNTFKYSPEVSVFKCLSNC